MKLIDRKWNAYLGKFENTWLGQATDEEDTIPHCLDTDSNGNYLILLELKMEKEANLND